MTFLRSRGRNSDPHEWKRPPGGRTQPHESRRAHPERAGAELTYDVRGDLSEATEAAPALMLIGTPMTAEGFTALAGPLEDRAVITDDPRDAGRSRCTTDATPTPEDHAADVHAILAALRSELGRAAGSAPTPMSSWPRAPTSSTSTTASGSGSVWRSSSPW